MISVYLIVLFMGAGLFIKHIERILFSSKTNRSENYDYAFEVIFHSIVVFLFTFLILKFGSYFGVIAPIYNFSDLEQQMNSIGFAAMLIIIMGIIAIVWCFIKHKFIKPLFLKIRNHITGEVTGTINLGYNSVYESIFHNPEITKDHFLPVIIYQNGDMVTARIISEFNPPNADFYEYKIEYVDEIMKIIEEDKAKSYDDKILAVVNVDYFSPTTNTLIRLYEPTRLENYWESLYGEQED